LPPPASPALRALRRLVARDPEAPVRFDSRGALARLETAMGRAAGPVVHIIDELLGGSGPAADHGDGEGVVEEAGRGVQPPVPEAAIEPALPAAAVRAAGPSQVLGNTLAGLTRHRRSASVAACLLLVLAAAVGTVPAISASGGPSATTETLATYPLESPATEPMPSEVPADQVADAGDVSIDNVMQPVDAPAGTTGFQVYVVRGGDTLAKIGAKFGLSRQTVYWANTARLPDPATLRIGQKLVIPPANGVTVTVKASDTLSGFASRYRVSTRAIMSANNLSGTNLTVGQLLLIPATPPAIPTPTPKPGCGASCGRTVWTGGKLRWPVPASRTITQYYNSRTHPAIDIGAPTGTPVVAAAGGTVLWAGWKYSGGGTGGGIEIWINHGGKLYTTYNHLSKVYVKVGQTVAAGQHIGNVGMTGNATGPHLHFEVWVCYPWSDGTTSCARNPLNYL
jgi:murein DD-endopeptidase MepM/ murein hydrolase activator NlpD